MFRRLTELPELSHLPLHERERVVEEALRSLPGSSGCLGAIIAGISGALTFLAGVHLGIPYLAFFLGVLVGIVIDRLWKRHAIRSGYIREYLQNRDPT